MRNSKKIYRPFLISISVLITVYFFGAVYIWQIEKRHTTEDRNRVLEVAASHAHAIERQLSQSLSATYALATILQIEGELPNFNTLADYMIAHYGGISALQLAPQGILTQIYPLQGNEKALGLNLLKTPAQRTEALKTIQSRQLTLAGPFELIQGGVAVLGRLPVFSISKDGSDKFWGFTIVSIRLSKLLEAAQVSTLLEKGYHYELSRTDPDSGKPVVFSRSGEEPLILPVSFSFHVPNGEWTFLLSPKNGWRKESHFYLSAAIVGVIGLSFAFLSFVLVRRAALIKLKSGELESSNKELQTALSEIKRLGGLLPICANCKKIRDDTGYWNQLELYIEKHSEASFTHGICPDCAEKLYGNENWYPKRKRRTQDGPLDQHNPSGR